MCPWAERVSLLFFLALDCRCRCSLAVPLTRALISFPRYLANDMEEDNQAPKQDIFYFLYGKNYFQHPLFHKLRYQMMRSMGWRMRVSREECEEVRVRAAKDLGGRLWIGERRKEWVWELERSGGRTWGEVSLGSSTVHEAVFLSRSRPITRTSGCGGETAPTCLRTLFHHRLQ
jgi:hypothetical protein